MSHLSIANTWMCIKLQRYWQIVQFYIYQHCSKRRRSYAEVCGYCWLCCPVLFSVVIDSLLWFYVIESCCYQLALDGLQIPMQSCCRTISCCWPFVKIRSPPCYLVINWPLYCRTKAADSTFNRCPSNISCSWCMWSVPNSVFNRLTPNVVLWVQP